MLYDMLVVMDMQMTNVNRKRQKKNLEDFVQKKKKKHGFILNINIVRKTNWN